MTNGHVYLIDHQRQRRALLGEAFLAAGYGLQAFESAHAFVAEVDYAQVPSRACVITHLDIEPMSAVELLDVLRADRVTLPTILMGETSELRAAVKAIRYGGAYILWHPFEISLLQAIVRSVLSEWNEAPPIEVRAEDRELQAIEDRFASLSRRQRQVLRYVFEGNGNRAIAEQLGISVKTVELHRACMMRKMRAESAASLIRMMSDYRHALGRCA